MDGLPADLDPRLARRGQVGADWVREQKSAGRTVTVVHHIDADGLSAGAIALAALKHAGVPSRPLAVKSLDDAHIELIQRMSRGSIESNAPASAQSALWFCDLGSTAYMRFPNTPRLVCDHHQLVRDGHEESFAHVNPLLDGLSGEEISGAGCAYLVAASLDATLLRLLPMALVGATADLQDRKHGAFTGANAALLRHGQAAGLVATRRDLAFFGPATRPLRKFLALAEPAVPGATGDQRTAEKFLLDCGVPMSDDAGERTWNRLTDEERRTVRSRLVDRLLDLGLAARADVLFRDVTTLAGEPAGPTTELQEFGTLLNSTARYGEAAIGLLVAGGDRGAAYTEALDLLLDHRKHLSGALQAFQRRGVTECAAVQWVHLEGDVLDTVVGIVAGMALDSLRRDRALVAFAWTPDGKTKVSTRSPQELQTRGIDLAVACREAAALFGGAGGGHKGAAGATIPRGAEARFILAIDDIVATQLGMRLVAKPAAPAAGETGAAPLVRSKGPQTRLAL